ncbi:MAG: glucokinase [Boseongicola sp.]|nr:MAG: glucokinase [Boseongicola sp.]
MNTKANDRILLVADVGGTNTRVALAQGDRLNTDSITRFRNTEYPGLESVLRAYLDQNNTPLIDGAAVAVAGPVRDGKGVLTNLDWSIDETTLSRASGAKQVAVLNDLQAQGYALGRLEASKLRSIVNGPAGDKYSTRLVVGVGTGFNSAPVFATGAGLHVPPSESGHANLPIRTDEDLSLMRFVETAHGFPAVEDVLSGRGLERVFAWCSAENGAPAERSAADIMKACEAGDDEVARQSVAVFIRILGTVCGNLSLVQLPFGGVYLVGGVSRAVAPYLQSHGFTEAFRDKGRFAGFMQNFAVHVVEDDYAALTGLATFLEN